MSSLNQQLIKSDCTLAEPCLLLDKDVTEERKELTHGEVVWVVQLVKSHFFDCVVDFVFEEKLMESFCFILYRQSG